MSLVCINCEDIVNIVFLVNFVLMLSAVTERRINNVILCLADIRTKKVLGNKLRDLTTHLLRLNFALGNRPWLTGVKAGGLCLHLEAQCTSLTLLMLTQLTLLMLIQLTLLMLIQLTLLTMPL